MTRHCFPLIFEQVVVVRFSVVLSTESITSCGSFPRFSNTDVCIFIIAASATSEPSGGGGGNKGFYGSRALNGNYGVNRGSAGSGEGPNLDRDHQKHKIEPDLGCLLRGIRCSLDPG